MTRTHLWAPARQEFIIPIGVAMSWQCQNYLIIINDQLELGTHATPHTIHSWMNGENQQPLSEFQMNQLSLKNKWSKFKIIGKTTNHFREICGIYLNLVKITTYNRLDFEILEFWQINLLPKISADIDSQNSQWISMQDLESIVITCNIGHSLIEVW